MISLTRPPVTKDELWLLVEVLWGVRIPRVQVCPDHVSPFDAFCEGYFGNKSNWALWYGSRGTGKSYLLALLALTKAAALDINVTLLGGSMAQSQNVQEHVQTLLDSENAPVDAIEKDIATEIKFNAGNWIRPLPASQKTVRGPHPHMTLLDEIDEMEYKIYVASLGQAMSKPNAKGYEVPEMTVASSTWQNPIGTFETVFRDAQRRNLPVRTWCYREVLKTEENPTGWMDPGFIERKKHTVPAEMFRVEYDLGEPAGTARAFDLEAFNRCLTDVKPRVANHKANDSLLVWESPVKYGHYAIGADWAKEQDQTVFTVWRLDVEPRTLVHLRAMNRKPWPEMIEQFNQLTLAYSGVSAHDATGIGNVVSDLIDERTIKFVMVGRERVLMLTEYIAAVERGHYAIPRSAVEFIRAHRSTSIDDVYRTTSVATSHLPDHVASAALAHRAATRGGFIVPGTSVPKKKDDTPMPTWMKAIDVMEPPTQLEAVGQMIVEVQPEWDSVGVFWLND